MLCYIVICKSPPTEGYLGALLAWQAGEN